MSSRATVKCSGRRCRSDKRYREMFGRHCRRESTLFGVQAAGRIIRRGGLSAVMCFLLSRQGKSTVFIFI